MFDVQRMEKKAVFFKQWIIENKGNILKNSERAAFFLGVLGVLLTEYTFLKRPSFFPLLYMIFTIPLLAYRIHNYRLRKLHFFLVDLCYFGNSLLISYLLLSYAGFSFPTLFQICYVLSHGPLLWAIPTWRNALVFHDIDRITSLFIHVYPPLVTFALRHYSIYGGFNVGASAADFHPFRILLWSTLAYVVWQSIYWLRIFKDREILERDASILTTERWFYQRSEKGPILPRVPPKFHRVLFIATHFLFFLITATPTLFLFNHYVINALVMCGVFAVAIWNGAAYYMVRFVELVVERAMREKNLTPPPSPAQSPVASGVG